MGVSLVNAFRVHVNPCNEMTLHGLREISDLRKILACEFRNLAQLFLYT